MHIENARSHEESYHSVRPLLRAEQFPKRKFSSCCRPRILQLSKEPRREIHLYQSASPQLRRSLPESAPDHHLAAAQQFVSPAHRESENLRPCSRHLRNREPGFLWHPPYIPAVHPNRREQSG